MTDLSKLSSFNKLTSKSFHQQRNFIKKVLAGKVAQCPECQQPLSVHMSDSNTSTIQCRKLCTDIELDCDAL